MKISEDQNAVLALAIKTWGHEKQMDMAIEECAEFIVAGQKTKRAGGRQIAADVNERAVDEIADVFVMMSQMEIIYGAAAIQERIDYKINRLKARLDASTPQPT